jgi:RNA polymerase sigma factor (sigma-70 family)
MPKRWTPSEEDFERLFNWLDANRDRAGEKYEAIRQNLIDTFEWRGCHIAEEMADETINRVLRKLPKLIPTYKGDPALYFYGFVNNMMLEYNRTATTRSLPIEPEKLKLSDTGKETAQREREAECLDKCLETLGESNRVLILRYYEAEGMAKINFRRDLAKDLGLATNALRVKIHRLRAELHRCISDCLKSLPEE